MRRITEHLLSRYPTVSHELKGRIRTFWYFIFIIIPVLVVFVTVMNIIIPRSIFQALNLVVAGSILLFLICALLLWLRLYNAAVNVVSFSVLAGLVFNAVATGWTGSAPRFVASHASFVMPILFATLFCRRWVVVGVAACAEASLCASLLTSPLLKTAEAGVVTGSISLAVVVTFIIGILIHRINDTARRLRKAESESIQNRQREINEALMRSMREVSKRLDESSADLSRNAGRFAENIQNQASSIEEITATMEEISSGADMVSQSARRQAESVAQLMGRMDGLVKLAREIEERTGETLKRTDEIAQSARAGEARIKEMDVSMNEISATSREMAGILGIINEISDRINLLSLNASIEAARAGEYGRGFAVVADEISKLAEQTASSVKEIAALIKQSETEVAKGAEGVRETVEVIRKILAGIEENSRMTAAIGSSIGEAIRSTGIAHGEVQEVRVRSDEIDVSTREQKTAAEEVMNTITAINELSQTNAAAADDITEQAAAIASMARTLRETIVEFDLGDAPDREA